MESLRDIKAVRSGATPLVLLAIGLSFGVVLGNAGIPSSVSAVADEARFIDGSRINVFPAGAGTHALLLDSGGYAWLIDCVGADGARRVHTGMVKIDGREVPLYRSFRTGEIYIRDNGGFNLYEGD
jgi:hypothetical protein